MNHGKPDVMTRQMYPEADILSMKHLKNLHLSSKWANVVMYSKRLKFDINL